MIVTMWTLVPLKGLSHKIHTATFSMLRKFIGMGEKEIQMFQNVYIGWGIVHNKRQRIHHQLRMYG
jgi:hypothetical protein